MERDNEQLVSDYLGGDEEAFEHLVKKNLDSVYGLAFRLTHDKALTEDIVQETFTKVWKKLDKYDKTKKFKPWKLVFSRSYENKEEAMNDEIYLKSLKSKVRLRLQPKT